MKSDDLRRAIGEIDDDLIEHADKKPRSNAKRNLKKWGTIAAALLLVVAAVFPLAIRLANRNGVGKVTTVDLMEGIVPRAASGKTLYLNDECAAAADFSLRLFREAADGTDNALISPLSALSGLAMLTNGAKGETLAQIETAVGMTVGEMNDFFFLFLSSLPREEKCRLTVADSVWFKSDGSIAIEPDFLQTNADYYAADAYGAPFDQSTLREINGWVERNTDGMIPNFLDAISPGAVAYLINAITFDAEWSQQFAPNWVQTGDFTTGGGETVRVSYMNEANFYGTGSYYLSDERATGLFKYYSGGRYAFVALLPNEGISLSAYLSALDGESLRRLISEREQPAEFCVRIPKFDVAYETDLAAALGKMGVTDVFDPDRANLSGIGSLPYGDLYLDCVIHKTFLSLNERGGRAGAASGYGFYGATAETEPKEVYLTRPFVYMLIDCETNLPLFIGTMNDPTK